MNNPNIQPEVWQVSVNGQIYEASFEELTQWIGEGALQPQDKVRRGNLRWLEAGKIPSLYGVFNARELGINTNSVQTSTVSATNEPIDSNQPPQSVTNIQQRQFPTENNSFETSNYQVPTTNYSFQNTAPNNCSVHPDVAAALICESCARFFCKDCPNSYGSVKTCLSCGSMCKPIAEYQSRFEQKNAFGKNEIPIVAEEVGSGAHWFFWIAGLSVVNTLIILSGTDWAFVAGLAVTQFIEGFFGALADASDLSAIHLFGVVLEFGVAGLFVLFAYFARRGAKWAFIVGMILYGLDGLLYLLVGSFIGVAIHAYVLYSLFKGFQACDD